MGIELDFGNYNNFRIDDARISLMVNGNEKSAVQMSVWERIKDFFRADKKSDAYQTLYHLLHDTEHGDKLDAFNALKSLAIPECRDFFKREIFNDDVSFFIGSTKVTECRLQKLMNISEQTRLEVMSTSEQDLFLKMLDTLREKETQYSDSYSSYIRLKMSDEHCHDLLGLYRPNEDVDSPSTRLANMDFLNYQEEKLLRHLSHRGGINYMNQFSAIGYQDTTSGIKFSMLHPSINYLREAYSKSHYNGEPSTDLNSEQMNMLNKVCHDYNYNKTKIDRVLHKIYEAHGKTLNISFAGRHENRMATLACAERDYLFQSTHSLKDISDSLDTLFHKWTTMDSLTS